MIQTGEYDFAWNLQVEPDIIADMMAGENTTGAALVTPGANVERINFNFSDPNTEVDGQRFTPHVTVARSTRRVSAGRWVQALDAYESAKFSGDYMTKPDEITNVTRILDDGRYAIACVRARVAGQPLPARRPACFFDPRHGMAVEDVPYAPPGGVERDVPACELDAERVKAGADPDTRLVMVGGERVPYWQGGRAYAPYAAGYFGGFGPMEWMFMGVMFGGGFDGLGEGLGGLGDGIGDGIGEIGDGIGGMFDGFDF